ncbi:HTH-type transcriptional regulator SutR [Thalassocella blandensis]|nr:HTH-type transcriptional regulator SutR [Thalassocella blandensis]
MDSMTLATLGRRLQELRLAKGVSLSQLAADAGIAKSNLSRLEQGIGNPTIDTIWRLALQLNVPFGSIVAPISGSVEQDGVQVRLIDQGHDDPKVDVYLITYAPNTERNAEAHSKGTRERVTVVSGDMEFGTKGQTSHLQAGESHEFMADQPHFYRSGDTWTTVMITIAYTREWEVS